MQLDFSRKTPLYLTLGGTVKVGKRTTTARTVFEAWSIPTTDSGSSLRQVFIVIREGGEDIETPEGLPAARTAELLGLPVSRVSEETGEVKKSNWVNVCSVWTSKGQAVRKVCPWLLESNPTLQVDGFRRRTVAPVVDPMSILFGESPDDYLEGTRAERPDAPF